MITQSVEEKVFATMSISKQRDYLTNQGYLLPKVESAAGKHPSFLLMVYRKAISTIKIEQVKHCRYPFYHSVKLTPQAVLLDLSINLRVSKYSLFTNFGVDYNLLPDTTYLLYLLWLYAPQSVCCALYYTYVSKDANFGMQIEEDRESFLQRYYETGMLQKGPTVLYLAEAQAAVRDELNTKGSIVYFLEYSLPRHLNSLIQARRCFKQYADKFEHYHTTILKSMFTNKEKMMLAAIARSRKQADIIKSIGTN